MFEHVPVELPEITAKTTDKANIHNGTSIGIINGINITKGDSWVSPILIFLLLYSPWKVLKINLQEYIEVKNAVKIPIPAA